MNENQNPTAPAQQTAPSGLLERLVGAVRSEFRVDVLIPGTDDAILGTPPCLVPACGRVRRNKGMCTGHVQRWDQLGRPEITTFITQTTPHVMGRGPLPECVVAGCKYGRKNQGLCDHHDRGWKRAGRPDLDLWIPTAVVADPDRPICVIPDCELWAGHRSGLCSSHRGRWSRWAKRSGSDDIEAFVRYCKTRGDARIDFRPLSPQLKLELQYAVQCRVDERRGRAKPFDLELVVRLAAASGARSLLQWSKEVWDEKFHAFTPRAHGNANAIPLGFLRFARRKVDDLAHGLGWEAEYERDVWDLHRVGIHAQSRRVRFDAISQPWLRQLVKRWARWKLTTDVSPVHVARSVTHLGRFATFLQEGGKVQVLAQVNREMIERFVAHIATTDASIRSRRQSIGALGRFLMDIRRHRWDATLPAEAVVHPEDYPKLPEALPRALTETVMAQIERPENLDRLTDPVLHLFTLILVRTGLRIGDAQQLTFDCIVHDAQGAPYLRYRNHKMKREGLVPIDDDLADQITAQQQRVLHRWSEPHVLLPRWTANPDGRWPMPGSTYRKHLAAWLLDCDVRDEHGRPVHLTPHQWRHTFATRLINLDVPQDVVRRLLDHQSHAMTAHYARLHDDTVRRHWEAARKVDITGTPIELDPAGPLAEATWLKDRLARAKQSLPNGYCGLPLKQTCPHANACLTCPVFITTPEFLPEHRKQRRRTLTLIETAKDAGHTRVVEMNQRVLGNLDRIITALEADQDPTATTGDVDGDSAAGVAGGEPGQAADAS
ncbi:tyrosine-type recombinase/integrase [Streptosporangium sp. NPDC050280]|uniref:tyrosine-type recombinase/integrase n=1 Tax=unclassified Streptosporangium TaxID=2632669 RepID=UPI00343CA4E0